jgi:transposase
MFTVEPLVISGEERIELERRARAHTSTQREARRARVILLCAEGMALRQIGRVVGMDQHQVGVWRRRFLEHRLDGLVDQPRSGRPRRLGHDERLKMAAIATSERDPADPVATWSYLEVAEALHAEGITVSVSQVWRILTAMDIDLTKVRGWLNRRDDPEFWGRVRDICGLYLDPPEQALVLSVDEKTSIQAKSRKHPDQSPTAGRPRRREFEYVRHGTASLFAALDVQRGEVLAEPIPPRDAGGNNSINFCSFLEQIERSVDPNLAIHVVLDNGSSHVSKYTKAWFAAHPRWIVHYTPPHASWVNQVELFFSILQRKVITNGNFSSRDDLVTKLLSFIADYDQTARPFKWTYAADPLVA